MDEFVYIKLPDTDGVAVTTRQAFDTLWREKGFVEANADQAAAVGADLPLNADNTAQEG